MIRLTQKLFKYLKELPVDAGVDVVAEPPNRVPAAEELAVFAPNKVPAALVFADEPKPVVVEVAGAPNNVPAEDCVLALTKTVSNSMFSNDRCVITCRAKSKVHYIDLFIF